jgi:hypothetical protein
MRISLTIIPDTTSIFNIDAEENAQRRGGVFLENCKKGFETRKVDSLNTGSL